MVVGDGDVAGRIEFERKRLGTFAGFFFGLRRVDVPVFNVVEDDFAAQVVLVRELVDVTGRGGVGDKEAGLREGVGGPDVGEGTTATIGDPEAGILRVPALAQVGVGGVVVVVRVGAAAVAAEETHVVDERLLAGFPEDADCAGIDAAGKDADAAEHVFAAGRR